MAAAGATFSAPQAEQRLKLLRTFSDLLSKRRLMIQGEMEMDSLPLPKQPPPLRANRKKVKKDK